MLEKTWRNTKPTRKKKIFYGAEKICKKKRTETLHHHQNGQSTGGYKDMNQSSNEGPSTSR
jgi:hypothetical protein